MHIHEILIKFLKNEINKQDLKALLTYHNIPIKDYNQYVLSICTSNCSNSELKRTCKPNPTSLKTNEFLDEEFIKDVKQNCQNRKMYMFQGLYKVSKDLVQRRILYNRKLQRHFVLRRMNPFNVEEIEGRIIKSCVEYGLECAKDGYASVIEEGIILYVRNMVQDFDGCDEKIVEEIIKRFPVMVSLVEKIKEKKIEQIIE